MEKVFKIMTAGLVLVLIDQIFMISKYSNISKVKAEWPYFNRALQIKLVVCSSKYFKLK